LLRLDIPAVIYQTSQGFQAFSLICTHLGCTLEEQGEGFSCPCHGSKFSADGKVIQGPAQADLDSLEIEVMESGELLLHKNGSGI
jgi:Rieske Fe-S protein